MATAEASERRKLGPFLATVLVAGNLIGSGVFLLPATLAAIGSITIWGWVISTLGALMLAGVFSVLARLKSSEEGIVGYVRQGLGHYFGFQAGLAYWLSCVIGNVALALAVTSYASVFFPVLAKPLPLAVATVAAGWLLILANLVGPRFVAKFGSLTLLVGLAPVLGVAIFGWFWFEPKLFAAGWNVSHKSGLVAVGGSLAPIFWAFLGVESAAVCGDKVRDPQRTVPIAAVGGVLLAASVYILAAVAMSGLLPNGQLAASNSPYALAATRILGGGAALLVAACAILKSAGTLGGWVLLSAETGRASADIGDLPAVFGRTRRDGVPAINLLLVGALMTVGVALSQAGSVGKQFGMLIDVATVLNVLVYGYCAAALLRFSLAMQPGRVRLLAQACGGVTVLFCLWLITASSPRELLGMVLVLGLTLPVWLLRRRWRQVTAARTANAGSS
jgi:arginine:agmatine antiporter